MISVYVLYTHKYGHVFSYCSQIIFVYIFNTYYLSSASIIIINNNNYVTHYTRSTHNTTQLYSVFMCNSVVFVYIMIHRIADETFFIVS